MNSQKRRLELVDSIRGFSILSMIGFHACWIMSFFGIILSHSVIRTTGFVIWERSICCTFIFISGFAFSLGSKQFKRGLIVLGIGIMLTILSCLFAYDIRDIFGVLWILGISPIIMFFIDKKIKQMTDNKIISAICFFTFIILTLVFWNVNYGYLGFNNFLKLQLPKSFYNGIIMTFLGFQDPTFYSVDYFSFFPWFFLYVAGYFAHKLVKSTPFEEKILTIGIPVLKTIGKHSLAIYLIHPVVIFIVCVILKITIFK